MMRVGRVARWPKPDRLPVMDNSRPVNKLSTMTPPASVPSTALLVLGMHRSGTSALTGALRLLGVELGARLVDPAEDNPTGYWEHAEAVSLHEALLDALGSAWDDPDPLPDDWQRHPAAAQARARIGALIDAEFSGAPLWCIKDPRLCRFLPLWLEALAERGIRPALLYVLRAPVEIAASLHVRDRLHPEVAALITLRHLLEAVAHGRDCDRLAVCYGALLRDGPDTLVRVGGALRLGWPRAPRAEADRIGSFLNPAQRHHHGESVASDAADAWHGFSELASVLHRALVAIAEGDGNWRAVAAFEPRLQELCAHPEGRELLAWHRLGAERIRKFRRRQSVQMAVLAQRVAESETAIASLESLATERLLQAERLDGALAEVTALARQRQDELTALDQQLIRTDAALAEVSELASRRLREVESLDQRLIVAEAADRVARAELAEVRGRLSECAAELAAMHQSLSWRLTAPLRRVKSWLRPGRGRQ